MQNKSQLCAYFLWLFFGAFGFHLIYLQRYRHTLFFWATFGLFGMEWFRNLFCISQYVEEANRSKEYIEAIKVSIKHQRTPKYSIVKFCGELLFGYICSLLMFSIFPPELYQENNSSLKNLYLCYIVANLFVPFAMAFGVWNIGNIGNEKMSFKWCLLGSFVGSLFYLYSFSSGYPIIISAIVSNWKGKTWRPLNEKKIGFCKGFSLLAISWILYSTCWTVSIYQNASIESSDGEKIRIKDAINNFFTSPAWTETKDIFQRLYEYYKIHGWKKVWKEFQANLDPEGEVNAYKVLGLESNASEKEISSAYKKLAKEWHPDKHSKEDKDEAAKQFMKIQHAYDILSKIRKRRSSKNSKSV